MAGPDLTPGGFKPRGDTAHPGMTAHCPWTVCVHSSGAQPLVPGAVRPSAHDKAKADGVPARLLWSRATLESGELGEVSPKSVSAP